MCKSTIHGVCFYNGKTLRTETYLKYVRNKIVILPLDVLIDSTLDKLLSIILKDYIEKEKFLLVLNCRYPLKI